MVKVRKAQNLLEITEVECEKLKKTLKKTEDLRAKLFTDKKSLLVQNVQYEKEIAASIKSNQSILTELYELRKEIIHEDLKEDNMNLDK